MGDPSASRAAAFNAAQAGKTRATAHGLSVHIFTGLFNTRDWRGLTFRDHWVTP